ncbi:MAG: DegQ family serine endoprotease [Nitrospirota bacterium]
MKQVRTTALAVIFVAIGVVIGFTLASDLGWLPLGEAQHDAKPAARPALVAGLPNFVEVSKAVKPAVVNISTTRLVKSDEGHGRGQGGNPFFEDPFFRRFFGDEFYRQFDVPRSRKEQSLGSGVIVDGGYIVTNNHVISKADEIKVVMSDKREFKGTLVGTDPKTDLAVIKVPASDLPVIPWGDSTALEVGEYVLAVGNPFGLNQTITMGIVSAVGRANVGIADYEDFIQTDAAINPGNSGGALVNVRGELVGINTAIFTRSGGYMGIGFAVPSQMVKSVIDSLVRTGKVVRGWLGVTIQEVSPELAKQFGLKEARGALVSDILDGSPADKAGIKRGDVVVEIDRKPVENASQLRNLVAALSVGAKATVTVIRDKKEKTVDVVIGEQPKDLAGKSGEPSEEDGGEGVLAGIGVHDLSPELAKRFGLSEDEEGVVVTRVEPGSVAEEAGVQRGDLILEVNRQVVRHAREFAAMAREIGKDESILLLVNRQGQALFLTLTP